MSNDYFANPSDILIATPARPAPINALGDAVEAAFDMLPDPDDFGLVLKVTVTAGGTGNAVTVDNATNVTSYVLGQRISFKATATNTGAATVNVDGLGVKTIKRWDGEDVAAGDITSGRIYDLVYDGTYFQLLSLTGGDLSAQVAAATAQVALATAQADAAAGSASDAATAKTNAETAEANAETAEANAEAAAVAADASADAAAASAMIASARQVAFVYAPSGAYIPTDNFNGTAGSDFGAANRLYAMPISRKFVADAMVFALRTATASSTCRVAIYASDGVDYGPGTLIEQSVSINCNTTGNIVATLSGDYAVSAPVWLVIQTGGTAPKFFPGTSDSSHYQPQGYWPQTTLASDFTGGSGFYFDRTDAALPASFPATARTNTTASSLPVAALRVT